MQIGEEVEDGEDGEKEGGGGGGVGAGGGGGGGGSTPVPFFSPNLPKFIGSSNHPEINSNTLEIQFFVTFFL